MGEPLGRSDLPEGIRLSVAAVARRIGVAPATLRTWDRRYGLGPSQHSAGEHRRYSAADVARLEAMQRLLQLGSPPGEAARAALAMEIPGMPSAVPQSDSDTAASPDVSNPVTGGGNVVSISDGNASARGLTRAAASLDGEGCARLISDSLDRRGVVATWNNLLLPVLSGLGDRWESTGAGVEAEHLLSEVVIGQFVTRIASLTHPANQRSVVLACAPEDLHTMPLFATAAALAERRVACRMLGARVPTESLLAAVRRTGPGAVLVWSQTEHTGLTTATAQVLDVRPAPLLLLGGPGWATPTPPGAEVVAGLQEAVTLITRTVCL